MIVDCFIFYNELDILKKRLRYLDSVVDKFVLVESTATFRGIPKELYYQNNKDIFKEWNDKIVHVVV
jgi:beta-1,4-mannosyl-glycoprotein beta-1,4-N-acetylglucosaminyltransferase